MKADLTLNLINEKLVADQGTLFRYHLRECLAQLDDAYRPTSFPFREHLGASLIGRECARELWLSFHWATLPINDGRMIRLFNRGHLEEGRFLALLKMIGCEVWQLDENGKQFKINGHNGHFGGSLDAVVRGIPEFPDTAILTEFKTHGEKSFVKLGTEPLQHIKPEHYVQMQLYMGHNGLAYGLYLAVNKNTDELYAELITFDQATYERYDERSGLIIDAVEPPLRINESPGWYKCKFCNHADVCHGMKAPHRNCRTCRWSTPVADGKWICENEGLIKAAPKLGYKLPYELSPDKQYQACDMYEEHPSIRARL